MAIASDTPAVSFEDVSRVFPGRGRAQGPTAALDQISFAVKPGQIVALVGPSGCGKTTVLELTCGIQQPDSGSVRAAPAALMPQRDLLLPWLSALDNATVALRLAGATREQARAQARPWFERFGLAGFEQARTWELSGGMRQRVSFMRSLLAGKPVLALDEPFASLDAITRADLQAWLASTLAQEPRTVLIVTHDVEEAILLADRVLVFSPRPGTIVADLPVALERPRHRTDPPLVALRASALAHLGVPA